MPTSPSFTRRWFLFFGLFFVVWYPVSLLLVTAYAATGSAWLFVSGSAFTPLWALVVSYLYFRRARNDWSARFVTAFGWMALMFVGSALLVEPFYGVKWTSLFTWDVVNANWINVVAILVGGIASAPPGAPADRTP